MNAITQGIVIGLALAVVVPVLLVALADLLDPEQPMSYRKYLFGRD